MCNLQEYADFKLSEELTEEGSMGRRGLDRIGMDRVVQRYIDGELGPWVMVFFIMLDSAELCLPTLSA